MRVLKTSRIAAFLAELPPDVVLLLEKAYTELAPPEMAEILPVGAGRAIHFRTFPIAYGLAGARIGYAVASLPTWPDW